MFVSWMTAAKVDGGISSLVDVTQEDFRYGDNMESFMFAETFKCVKLFFVSDERSTMLKSDIRYHYLLQSEPDLLSLDDYVLNTG